MTIRRYSIFHLVFSLFVILPQIVKGQEKDFGVWLNTNIEHSFSKKFDMSLKTSFRTYHNASLIDEVFLEGEMSYAFNKYFSASGSYRISETREGNDGYHTRHKLFAGAKGKLPVDRFTLSARAMLQVVTRTYQEDENDLNTFYTGRLKLKVAYNINNFPVDLYLGIESFTRITVDTEHIIDKARFNAGFEYKITKGHSVELEYILERDETPDLNYLNIVSATYNFSF